MSTGLPAADPAAPKGGKVRVRDPERTRANILHAALVEFSARGFAGASIDAIAAQKTFLLQHGFIAADFDIAEWIDAAPLALAREMPHERAAC